MLLNIDDSINAFYRFSILFQNACFFYRHGADPNVVSNKGLTPCHEAVLNGNRDVILAILGAKNLDVKTRTKKEYQKVKYFS